jgi:hypothetical protein
MEAQITIADELVGAIRIPPRPLARLVLLANVNDGYYVEGVRKAHKERLRVRGKNARAWERRKAEPMKDTSRAAYQAQWAKDNAERIRKRKAAWRKKNLAWVRKYQREWARRKAEGGSHGPQ